MDIKEIYEYVTIDQFQNKKYLINLFLNRSYKNTDYFVGVFNCRSPQILITNAELARRILITDFKHFHDNEISQFVSIFYKYTHILTDRYATCVFTNVGQLFLLAKSLK